MTNIDTTDNIQIDGTGIEKATNYECLEQTIAVDKRTMQEVSIRMKAGWSIFGKIQRDLSGQAPSHESIKKSLQPVCLTSNDIRMPNMVPHKSIRKEA